MGIMSFDQNKLMIRHKSLFLAISSYVYKCIFYNLATFQSTLIYCF